MQHFRRLAAHPLGYTLLLAIGIGLFLLAIGLNADALPFQRAGEFSDAATSHWPNALYLQQTIRTGQFPLWRPLIMSGQPFATNPLNKVWYPPQWLVLLLPVTLHLNLLLWLHLVLAGVGMRAFAQQIGFSTSIASLMGAAYALTPRLVAAAGAGHLDVVYAVAWFPWVMWGIARVDSLVRAALLGLIAALCFLADVRMSIFIFVAAGLYALYCWNRGPKTLFLYIFAATITVGLTALQWLPLIALLRGLSRSGLTAADAGIFSLQVPSLIGLFVADQGGAHETMVYVGVGILALAAVGLLSRNIKPAPQFWIGAAVISGLYALGVNGLLWSTLVRVVPPLLWLRVPARTWMVVVFALIILAGRGLMALGERGRRAALRRMLPLTSAVLIGIGMACAILGFPARSVAALLAVGFTVLSALFLIANQRFGLAAWAVLIALDLLIMDVTLIEGRSRADWLDRYRPLAETLIAAHATRVYSPSYSLPQQAAAYWNIQTFSGVDPFQFSGYVKVVEEATGIRASSYSVTLPALEGDPASVNRDAKIDAELLAHWQVSHVVSAFPIQNVDLELLAQPGGVYVYRNKRYSPDRYIVWNNPNQFTLRAGDSPEGIIPTTQGWQSKSVQDGQFIQYTYSPPEVYVGMAISGLTVLLMGAVLFFGRRRRAA